MNYKPHTYQKHAEQLIIEKPAILLAVEMGLGKTVTTLTAVQNLLYDRFEVQKVLVIAPLRVASVVWSDEIEKWTHLQGLQVSKILGSEKQRLTALDQPADIYLINRENVVWLVQHYGTKWPFDMVVIDESSSFKDPQAKRFRALRTVRPKVKRIVELTGTPSPNGYMDLWPQVYLLDRGERLEKTITGYRSRYFEPDKRNATTIFSWQPRSGAIEAIQQKIADVMVSMKAEDWLKMPQRIDNTVRIRLEGKAKAEYRQLERDLLLPYADGDVVAGSAAVLSNKLLQMANGAVYDENQKVRVIHDLKLDALDELQEAANGKPMLVFYWYKHDADRILRRFPKARKLETEVDIKDWNSGTVQMMLAHPASAGHGLNLQSGGNQIVWFGLTWSLELYEQANARLHRQGQTQTVIVHHLIAEGTMDEQVMQALSRKDAGQKGLMEAVKARITEVQNAGSD